MEMKNWQDCQTCKQPTTITQFKEQDGHSIIKMLAGSDSIVICSTAAYHLRSACMPKDAAPSLVTCYDNISNRTISSCPNVHEELEISRCPICMESVLETGTITLVQLPCRHFYCDVCLYYIVSNKLPSVCCVCKTQFNSNASVLPMRIRTDKVDLSRRIIPHRQSSLNTLVHAIDAAQLQDDRHQFDRNVGNFYQGAPRELPSVLQVESIDSFSSVLVNCITEKATVPAVTRLQQSYLYNDLLAGVYDHTTNTWTLVNYKSHPNGFVLNNIRVRHSADKLDTQFINGKQIRFLYHNMLIEWNGPYKCKCIPVDVPCQKFDNVTSKLCNSGTHSNETTRCAVIRELDAIRQGTNTGAQPVCTILCTQTIFMKDETHMTLRDLNVSVQPSMAICTTDANGKKNVYSAEWIHDSAPLTCWCILAMYDTQE